MYNLLFGSYLETSPQTHAHVNWRYCFRFHWGWFFKNLKIFTNSYLTPVYSDTTIWSHLFCLSSVLWMNYPYFYQRLHILSHIQRCQSTVCQFSNILPISFFSFFTGLLLSVYYHSIIYIILKWLDPTILSSWPLIFSAFTGKKKKKKEKILEKLSTLIAPFSLISFFLKPMQIWPLLLISHFLHLLPLLLSVTNFLMILKVSN